MRCTIILFSFLMLSATAFAQHQKPNIISISSEGSVDLPADVIQFNINLNAEADSPQKAYSLHQEREQALVQLLDKYEIKEEDIRFDPISIRKSVNNGRYNEKETTTYQTHQSVSVKFTDFDIYEKIQIALIEENFDNFNGNFLSSKAEEGEDTALKKAIQAAKEKAALIAKEASVKLGPIVGINYGHSARPYYDSSAIRLRGVSSENQLMKYDQVVTVTADISIEFAIIQ